MSAIVQLHTFFLIVFSYFFCVCCWYLFCSFFFVSICPIHHWLGVHCARHYTVVQSNHRKLKIPRVGEQITIIPTHVLNAKEFYGQLGVHFNALQYSQQCLNYRRFFAQNVPYPQLPGIGNAFVPLFLLFCQSESIKRDHHTKTSLFWQVKVNWCWLYLKMEHSIEPEFYRRQAITKFWYEFNEID